MKINPSDLIASNSYIVFKKEPPAFRDDSSELSCQMFSEVIGLQIVQKGDDKELARRTKKTDSSKSASSPCV